MKKSKEEPLRSKSRVLETDRILRKKKNEVMTNIKETDAIETEIDIVIETEEIETEIETGIETETETIQEIETKTKIDIEVMIEIETLMLKMLFVFVVKKKVTSKLKRQFQCPKRDEKRHTVKTCYNCSSPNHLAINCPSKNE